MQVNLTLQPPDYSIGIFTHLKLCLADAIHNFKWVKIIHIWQNGCNYFQILLINVTFFLQICFKAHRERANDKCRKRIGGPIIGTGGQRVKALNLLYKPWRQKGFFHLEVIINVFPIYLNTHVMGLRPLKICLTITVRGLTLDVRIWRLHTSDSDI